VTDNLSQPHVIIFTAEYNIVFQELVVELALGALNYSYSFYRLFYTSQPHALELFSYLVSERVS